MQHFVLRIYCDGSFHTELLQSLEEKTLGIDLAIDPSRPYGRLGFLPLSMLPSANANDWLKHSEDLPVGAIVPSNLARWRTP
ncbi:hypothetical protein GCM10010924_53570 [Rhizobium wenxiniae]|nr:hypothetical protein GCM10010924_53570 [Rhizobium wenxiniae]